MECSPHAYELLLLKSPDTWGKMVANPQSALCRDQCIQMINECPFMKTQQTFMQEDDATIARMTAEEYCDNVQDRRHTTTTAKYNKMCYPGYTNHPWSDVSPSNADNDSPGCFCVENIQTSGIYQAIALIHANDNSGRMFVGQQNGVVSILKTDENGRIAPVLKPFLNIEDNVYMRGEQGFLGMAFHPDHVNNRRFFVYYSRRRPRMFGNVAANTRISEFLIDSENPDMIDPNTERLILDLPQPWPNHNGGMLSFGTDGYLYLFTGDGGSAKDPLGSGQDKGSLLGKVLRIDVSNTSVPYTIPPGNPFISETGTRPEIYAYGMRNPWRADFDDGNLKTGRNRGRIFVADVGQWKWEEVDLLKKGGNFGWNSREGYECFTSQCGKIGPEILPIFAYDHKEGVSIDGIQLYRGARNPNYEGSLIVGDLEFPRFGRTLWKLTDIGAANWTSKKIGVCSDSVCDTSLGYASNAQTLDGRLLSFGKDQNSELYILHGMASGSVIQRFADPFRRTDPIGTKIVCRLDVVVAVEMSCNDDTYMAKVKASLISIVMNMKFGYKLTVIIFAKNIKVEIETLIDESITLKDIFELMDNKIKICIKRQKRKPANLKRLLSKANSYIGQWPPERTIFIVIVKSENNIPKQNRKIRLLQTQAMLTFVTPSTNATVLSKLETLSGNPVISLDAAGFKTSPVLQPGVGFIVIRSIDMKQCTAGGNQGSNTA
ncbi:unnamed protein product [Owenia fusiformis]|uniref:Uncharacterized protein n=1 Tax=Owenia fusiformis TaxID=6347 RepID=A0A8J1TYU9_OWEFU|nr:unnamed protein product [Owenia fusiformis]